MKKVPQLTVKLSLDKLVRVTEDHGGYDAGECLLCGASGWLDSRFGHHHSVKGVGADLQHKKNCPINKELR